MFYYKHIDIDNNVSQEMKEWGLENIQKSDDPVVKFCLLYTSDAADE